VLGKEVEVILVELVVADVAVSLSSEKKLKARRRKRGGERSGSGGREAKAGTSGEGGGEETYNVVGLGVEGHHDSGGLEAKEERYHHFELEVDESSRLEGKGELT
jgi:hypothetical protein